jgi:predicted DNA-binding transcriptional regulator AlpA
MPDRLLTHSEVAEWLQIPEQTLYRWESRGVAPRSSKIGRYTRYQLADVLAFVEARASKPASV